MVEKEKENEARLATHNATRTRRSLPVFRVHRMRGHVLFFHEFVLLYPEKD